jgi:hypothetical protein
LQFAICGFCFFVCLACSGSRGAYISLALQTGFLLVSSLLLLKRTQGFKIIGVTILVILVAIVLFNFVFTEQLELILYRQELASQSEGSIFGRIFGVFLDFESLVYADLTFLGVGIGMGSGGGAFLATGTQTFLLSESEWARHVLEAGIVMGLIYILFRIALCFSLFADALKGLFSRGNPVPLMFCSYTLLNLLAGSITGNGITYSFNWIFVGFTIAINKTYTSFYYKKPVAVK